ncbi:hypothetical protein [Flavobacterium sp.]|uniref:hypothetical protein n=1 Tax=Flavobacterium sp. TaxID=239 RepID=UPI003752874A
MTIKEAVIISLEELNNLVTSIEVYNYINAKKYYDFGGSKTPAGTVSAQLGHFIRNEDARVKRIKKENGFFVYYLSKNEASLNTENETPKEVKTQKEIKSKTYEERDLHKLLSSFLKASGEFSKTIFHEQSNRSDEHQKWVHPDMVGIRFLKLQTNVSQTFLKAVNRIDTFKLTSYEIKKEINTDYELKKCFFQAVSNSSWANYGYLVAFEVSDNIKEEMERLNQSFGIGVILLKTNPYESKILFQARYKDLDFKTIDKLCKINIDFEKFIEQTEKLMMANEKYSKSTEKEFEEFCDSYFINDSEAEKYCEDKNIPQTDYIEE